MNKFTKILLPVFLIGAVFSVSGCGKKIELDDKPTEKEKKEVVRDVDGDSQEVIEAIEEVTEIISSDIDTSDWETYRNEEYGFEFKYPKRWIYESPAYPHSKSTNNPYYIIGLARDEMIGDWSITVAVQNMDIDELLSDPLKKPSKEWGIINKTNIVNENNYIVQRVYWDVVINNENLNSTYFQKNEFDEMTYIVSGSKYHDIKDGIVLTFKFID